MNISGTAGSPPSGNDGKGSSFEESLRRESAGPKLGVPFSRSFQAADLAAGFSFVSPDFVPALGDGILDATALAEGANDEMRRYEEETNDHPPLRAS